MTGTLRETSGFTVPVTTNSGRIVRHGRGQGKLFRMVHLNRLTSTAWDYLGRGGASPVAPTMRIAATVAAPGEGRRQCGADQNAFERPFSHRVRPQNFTITPALRWPAPAKIRKPHAAGSAAIGVRRAQVVCPGRAAARADILVRARRYFRREA